MNNKQNTKVRLVKCPRCAKLLPEPEHVPLYTCGGCGTTLQAKYYRGNHKDLVLTSHEREVKRSNGIIHARNGGESDGSSRRSSSSVEHSGAQDKGRDQVATENSSTCKQNGAINSSDHTSLSKESSFLENKENGLVDKKVDQLDLKDQNRGGDQDAVESCSDAEKNGAADRVHHTALREESSFIENKENGGTDNEIDQIDSKNHVANGLPAVLEKKEREQHLVAKPAMEDGNDHDEQCNGIVVENHQQKQRGDVNYEKETFPQEDSQVLENGEGQNVALVKGSTEDDDYDEQKQVAYTTSSSAITNAAERFTSAHVVSKATKNMHLVGEHTLQDQHEEKQIGCVNSSIEASSLTVSSAIENLAEHRASDHEVYEETRKMHQQFHQDQHEQKQAEHVNSSIEASLLTESSAIKNLAEHDASDHEVSKETREIHLVEKQSHQNLHKREKIGHVNSSIEASLLTESSAIKNLAEHDASVSKESREIHLVGKHSQQNQHEREQIGDMNSSKNASVSSSIENPVKHDASDHEVLKETRKMHLGVNRFDQYQPEQKQVAYVNSAKSASSLNESSAIKNPSEHDAFRHEVSEVSTMMPILGKDSHHDRHEQTQDPVKDASSATESVVIKKPIQLTSGNSANYDASDHEVSKETRKMELVGKHSHQDVSGNEINCHDVDEVGVEKSGKEFCNERDSSNLVAFNMEQRGSVKLSSEASSFTEVPQGGNDSVAAPSSVTNLKTSHEMGTAMVSRDPHCGSISVDDDKGTSKQNAKNFGGDAVYTDSEVGSLLTDVTRYPKQRSPAYDGSVSSFDGNDDQMEEQPAQVVEETLSPNNAVAGYDGAEESPEWNHTLPGGMMYRNSRVQTQARSSSSVQLDKKLKSSVVDGGGPPEEYDLPRKINRYRPNRDSFLPRVPYHRRSSEIAFETGSSSSYALHDEPPSHQMHHHPYRRRFPEVPLWREKEFLSMHYNYETSGEIYDRPNYYHAYGDRRRRAESWSQSGTLPRMPYSGEIFNGRQTYMHRYPDDRRWSAQLPPPAVCFHQGVYMGPTWETRQDPYDSYPTSPQRYVESESSCAWGHDTVSLSDDQRHRDQIMRRLYLREKRQAVKKQFHPTAGGAPFISCYICFNILQLPKGFLVSRGRARRTHKLQCGACSSVLEFSLENEGGLAPSETIVDRNANQAVSSSSHVNHSRHSSLNSVDGRELLSRDSFGASSLERTKLFHESSRTRERMERLHDDDEHPGRGRTAKVTWKLPARSKSPLHRLMGYSSPQDLLSVLEADDVK